MKPFMNASRQALVLTGMMCAATALAAEDLEVTMDVLDDGQQAGTPVNQVIRLPEPARAREQARTQTQNPPGDSRQVREQIRYEYRYRQPATEQDETSPQREQNREMRETSQQVREQARELREQAQEEISQMREETRKLREEVRDMRSNGG